MAGNIVYTKQSSFAGGEVSPDMWGRDDHQKYAVSAKTMENFIPHPYGGASNRPGSRLVCEVKDSSKKVKLLPFQFSVEQAYIIEAGENYLRYIKDGGQIVNGSTIVETTTTYAEDDLFDLKTAQSADTMYLCHNNYPPKTLTRSSHTSWAFADFDYENGPFRTQNNTDTTITPSAMTGTGITLTASSSIFNANHIGSLWQISHDVTDQSINGAYAANTTSSSIKCKGKWSLVTSGTWKGTLKLQRSKDNGSTWQNIRSYASNSDTNIEDSGETDDLYLLRLDYTYTSGTCSINLNAYSFINNGIVEITAVASGTSATANVLTDLSAITATKNWAEGAWSLNNGYPACAKFYQNRLCLAGSTKDPLTAWLSQVGDYPNFLVNSPVEDDDAITAPLVSEGVNAIRSMISMTELLAFTAGGTWKIGSGSESAALTPTSTRGLQQEYIGSSNLAPIAVGNRIVYCQEMGATVRDIGYSLTDDAYKGDDLTLLARHMFRSHSIVDWAFCTEPDNILYAVRDDGVLLSLTYNKEQNVFSWARHITDGTYESIATIPGNGYTDVYVVVKRTINGTVKRFIEVFAHRMESNEPQDQFFVDCGLSYDNPIDITGATKASPIVVTAVAHGFSNGDYVDIQDIVGMTELNGNRYKVANKTTDTFELVNMDDNTNINGTAYTSYISGGVVRKAVHTVSGLNHLEGKIVSILADGSVDAQQTVISGAITLTDYASRVHVGLPYTCDLETLNIDFQMKDGTIQGRKKAVRNVKIRLEESTGGYVGINNADNLEQIEYDLSTVWGKPADLFTGDKQCSPYCDYDTDARIYIRQSDPLPITVLAIMGDVEFGG